MTWNHKFNNNNNGSQKISIIVNVIKKDFNDNYENSKIGDKTNAKGSSSNNNVINDNPMA